MVTLQDIKEEIRFVKPYFPTSSNVYKDIYWNFKEKNHDLIERFFKRTKFKTRKSAIETILKGLDSANIKIPGPYVLYFLKSDFYLVIFVNSKSSVTIKTVLSSDMLLRFTDKVMTVNEAEALFTFDLSSFYKNGFKNAFYGSLLIEESIDRKVLEVHPEYIDVNF